MRPHPPQSDTAILPLHEADLPTRFGQFRLSVFVCGSEGEAYTVLTRGIVAGRRAVPVRLHSACLTSEAFGSLRCDCKEQLDRSLKIIGEAPCGALIYLPQEGRGIGIVNKIAAYALQDGGLDTIEANRKLRLADDGRSYDFAAGILRHLKIGSIDLLTNNPDKIRSLEANGLSVERRTPLVVEPNAHSAAYLAAKRRRCGHMLPDPGTENGLCEETE